jgi:hypothetical protein
VQISKYHVIGAKDTTKIGILLHRVRPKRMIEQNSTEQYRRAQSREIQNRTKQSRTRLSRTLQCGAEKNRRIQNRTEQNRTEQNRTKQKVFTKVGGDVIDITTILRIQKNAAEQYTEQYIAEQNSTILLD